MNDSEFPRTCADYRVAGVDEAGRGPLAGPVVVAAVILPPDYSLPGLDDSKRVNVQRRDDLFDAVRDQALAWSVQIVDAREIETLNILAATLEGMRRSVTALVPSADYALVDGNRLPSLPCEGQAIVEGDHRVPAISAASILAKVTRDRLMCEYHHQYPQYGFNEHKGYPTPQHLERLRTHGPCPIHRKTFKPVRELIEPGLF